MSNHLPVRLILGAATGVAATLLTAAFHDFFSANLFTLFLVAVLSSALSGGFWTGVAATVSSSFGMAFFLYPPYGSLRLSGADTARLLIFFLAGLLISALSRALRAAERAADERAESLRESEASYRALFDNIGEAVFLLDPADRSFVDANRAAADMLGVDREDILGRRPVDFSPPETRDRLLAMVDRVDRAFRGEPQRVEWRALRRDGVAIETLVSLSVTHYFGRDLVLAAVHDLSETRRLERELGHSQKLGTVGLLAGGIAHDFNNVLTAIRGHATLALETLTPDDAVGADLREIDRAAELASALARQLLGVSRDRDAEPGEIALDDHVTALGGMLRRLLGRDIELVADTRAPEARVILDPGQLEQIVLNLVVNARDAMPDGGRITLGTWVARDGERDVAVLEVRDQGVGMDEATRARIFDAFFTTKEEGRGTGLGLSVVQRIVRRAGGTIDVWSHRGTGSAFTLRFPLASAASAA